LYRSISGAFLASFNFNETGIYKVSVELAGINFIPINPVFVNFNVISPPGSTENLRINFATSILNSDRASPSNSWSKELAAPYDMIF
jgi:hypothetical protein